jgi:hypothetical protein
MTARDAASEEELAFEQRLLAVGRSEPLPSDRTEAALLRFSASVAAFQSGLSGAAASTNARPVGAPSGIAAQWLALGVVLGGALTFAWLTRTAPARPSDNEGVSTPALSAPFTSAIVSSPPADLAPPPVPQAKALGPTSPPRFAPAPSRRTKQVGSSLTAEVAALDAIQASIAIGAWEDADLRLSRYRRDFAGGALRGEAEVLAITSLLGQGRQQAAASAAERFIAQRPRDPQVERVRRLTLSK